MINRLWTIAGPENNTNDDQKMLQMRELLVTTTESRREHERLSRNPGESSRTQSLRLFVTMLSQDI